MSKPAIGSIRLWTVDGIADVQVWTGKAWSHVPRVLSLAVARADQAHPMPVATIEVILDYGDRTEAR